MIKFVTGDLFDSGAEAFVNTVNCVGVMGRGVALQFKKRYPDNFSAYKVACEHEWVVPGKMFVHETNTIVSPRYIINFPTKRHWRGASKMGDIEAGLAALVGVIQKLGIKSIAVPPLGCGLGGLDWGEVKSRMADVFSRIADVDIIIFEPNGAPLAKDMPRNREVPEMTNGRAALVCLMKRYLDGLLDPFVTLLEIHKLMYFLQECGEPLRLRYVKLHYGPYAENLSGVLNAIEGHLLSGYADGGDKPSKQIQIVPGAVEDALAFLNRQPETLKRINRVTELADGFETPFGMELLATVHWVAKNEAKTMALPEIIKRTHEWGRQKHKFSERQIKVATERLVAQGWILGY